MSKLENEYLNGVRGRIPVEYAHIFAETTKYPHTNGANVYFNIEYKPIDSEDVMIGFGSYALDLVQAWLDKCFEVVEPNE